MEVSEKPAFLKIASSVAKAAGDRLSAIRERRVNSDAGNDIKLQEDVESEMFIREKLEPTGIPVIGEENGGDASLACSAETQTKIDQRVVELVKAQHEKAVNILTENRAKLDELAQYLYEKETITGEEFMHILNAK